MNLARDDLLSNPFDKYDFSVEFKDLGCCTRGPTEEGGANPEGRGKLEDGKGQEREKKNRGKEERRGRERK